MKKEIIMASVYAFLATSTITNISSFDNPYYTPYIKLSNPNDNDSNWKDLSLFFSTNQSLIQSPFSNYEAKIQKIDSSEQARKMKLKFDNWFDRYCRILSHGTDYCDELIDQLKADQEDFFFHDFLMKFMATAPLHLREIFLDDLFIGDIDIFTKTYKDMLEECSNSPSKTLARKARNILELYSKEFDLL